MNCPLISCYAIQIHKLDHAAVRSRRPIAFSIAPTTPDGDGEVLGEEGEDGEVSDDTAEATGVAADATGDVTDAKGDDSAGAGPTPPATQTPMSRTVACV